MAPDSPPAVAAGLRLRPFAGESAFDAARLYKDCGFVVVKRNALYRKPVDRGTAS